MSANAKMPAGPLVFDSWALLAFLQDEPAAAAVESLILDARTAGQPLWVTSVNLGEVWCRFARTISAAGAEFSVAKITEMGFRVKEADWTLTRIAAEIKAANALAYAGCFAAALASQLAAELVTGDPEFRKLARHIRIRWLRSARYNR